MPLSLTSTGILGAAGAAGARGLLASVGSAASERAILDAYVAAFVDVYLSVPGLLVEGAQQAAQLRAVDFASRRGASVISGVDDFTRDRIESLADQKIAAGWTDEELRERIAALGVDEARALTLARTETWTAYNIGEAEAWEDQGVEFVRILDGEDFDEPCIQANGQLWTLEDYQANPLQHPNCQRMASSVGAAELSRLRESKQFTVSRPVAG